MAMKISTNFKVIKEKSDDVTNKSEILNFRNICRVNIENRN